MPPGREDFSTPGNGGEDNTITIQQRPGIVSLDESQTGDVAAGETEVVSVYAPTDAIYEAEAMQLVCNPPGGATSGAHSFAIRPAGTFIESMRGQSNYDSGLTFNRGIWTAADKLQYPQTEAAQVAVIDSMVADENDPLEIRYINQSDATQSNERRIRLLVKESKF